MSFNTGTFSNLQLHNTALQSPQSSERGDFFMGKPECKLIGQDGNIFNLMGIVGKTLRQNDLPEQADEMAERIMGGEAESYSQALAILMEYVDIV